MQPLEPGISYHIFNHANGFENVFCKKDNYCYFLEKVRLYISPIAEIYAYCLMPNHFHLVIRIRQRKVIEDLIIEKNFPKVLTFGKVEGINKISDNMLEKFLSKQFANLFSCYTQSFNKVFHRMGSLFIKNFKREPILDKQHFLNFVIYTHRNPIHHGFRKNYDEWEFSSYNEIVEGVCDHIEVGKLLKIACGLDSFKEIHREALEHLDTPYDLETTCIPQLN